MLSEQLLQSPFCIYGAGIVATSVYTAIKTLYKRTPLFFLISDLENRRGRFDVSPSEIDGIAVKQFSEWKRELEMTANSAAIPVTYLIAVPEEHHAAIIEILHSLVDSEVSEVSGTSMEEARIVPITNILENELMEAYYNLYPNCTTVSALISQTQIQESKPIQVYQAKSHMDKPLRAQQGQSVNQSSILPRYITPIQVGAALTNRRIVDLQDNQGDNISAKNRNYCELTATYYAWKHSRAAYKGICHYRRIFDISDEQMKRLLELEKEWDVILPYPSVYYPNISKEHARYVNESDWNAMLQALQETAPEYLEAYEKGIADGERFFNNFNMLIAKSEVFDDYCNFLFTVLERTEELTTPKGSERADRFAGYLGENLTTLYFLRNRERLKIAYAGKLWLT